MLSSTVPQTSLLNPQSSCTSGVTSPTVPMAPTTSPGISNGSPTTLSTSSNSTNSSTPVVYGELVILGYNGSLPSGNKDRRSSKFTLKRRPVPNGIKKYKHYVVKQPQMTKAIQDKGQHSISYTLSRNQAVIVEYTSDSTTDMFQVGRSSETPIDFIVIDTPSGVQQADGSIASHPSSQQSTISRFACRILVERKPPYTARIFAAGFDSSNNIFLGEKAIKWQQNGEIDGLTTNGVLIMHPRVPFGQAASVASGLCATQAVTSPDSLPTRGCSQWREVSVCGGVYAIRETRSAAKKGNRIRNESNVLQDGTLIDLCGATLIWRSAEGLKHSPTRRVLEEMIDMMNAARPLCPVGLNTLVIPRCASPPPAGSEEQKKQPYVYLKCGHVQGLHYWGSQQHSNSRKCPICMCVSPVVKLSSGLEGSFYVDCSSPSYAFKPCGHMASEKTVKNWASVAIPHGTNGFHPTCPFCACPLQGKLGYVRLIFQDHVD